MLPELHHLGHLHFNRDLQALCTLFRIQKIEAFKTYDPATAILHENDIVVGLLTHSLFEWVIKPDAQSIPFAIKMNSYFVHNSRPFFGLVVKYAVTTKCSVSFAGAVTTQT